ncbi:hypothetical protein TTHERM_01076910 (macronuclear) [Tetrahymena thermophila SB210]|uniref:Uncharacterized protein n=1 Tax=Tetrahymena thermophila (strain SB210) TaxID=312017 RepID=Q22C48_TETTS|nr:hypothetical protein TTHERM_01076910 [Tetrahymena thermophila SB210]EAR82864.2 hypothetical protein TTHERM_01076910 [Tetrahymena thermophila SB210]|eukprot:XP_001030527.2 hypothetical protein TTHERM_01076910 [Tetrahymena thermophila SB210]
MSRHSYDKNNIFQGFEQPNRNDIYDNLNQKQQENLGLIYATTQKRAKRYQESRTKTLSNSSENQEFRGNIQNKDHNNQEKQELIYFDSDNFISASKNQKDQQQQMNGWNNSNNQQEGGSGQKGRRSNTKSNTPNIRSERRQSKIIQGFSDVQALMSLAQNNPSSHNNSAQKDINQSFNQAGKYQQSNKHRGSSQNGHNERQTNKNKDQGNQDLLARPYELIEIRDQQLILNEDLLQEILIKYEGNINIISVIGLPGKGKSQFLNKFLSSKQTKKFYERDGGDQGTEGAVLWGQPIYNPVSNTHTFLIDVQGIDTFEEVNLKLQLFIMLMSDQIIFYSNSDLRHVIYDEMSFLIEFENKLNFPITDLNISDYMPELYIIAKEQNFNSEMDLLLTSELQNFVNDTDKLIFEGDVVIEQILHFIKANSNHQLLKIKNILNSAFRDKKCFLQKFGLDDSIESIDQAQFFSVPDRESSAKKSMVPISNNQISNFNQKISVSRVTPSFQLLNSQMSQNIQGINTMQSQFGQQVTNIQGLNTIPSQLGQKTSFQGLNTIQSQIGQINNIQGQNTIQNQLTQITKGQTQKNSIYLNTSQFNNIGKFQQTSFTNLKASNTNVQSVLPSISNLNINKMVDQLNQIKTDVEFLRKIINLPQKYKKFKNIPINSYTFCKYLSLLIEQINQGKQQYFEPRTIVSQSVNYEFQRVLQILEKDHQERIQYLVNFDNFSSMQKLMQSLFSIRNSIIEQFNASMHRFVSDSYFKEIYQIYFQNLKKTLDFREEQVFKLFQNISYGINEKWRINRLEELDQQLQEKSKLVNTLENNNQYIKIQQDFKDLIQMYCKDILQQNNDIDGLSKVFIFQKFCVQDLGRYFQMFANLYDKSYQEKQLQIIEKDSHKKLFEIFFKRFEIIKQKTKLLDDVLKNLEKENENQRELVKALDDKFIKSYEKDKAINDRKTALYQKLLEKEDQLKIITKKKNRIRTDSFSKSQNIFSSRTITEMKNQDTTNAQKLNISNLDQNNTLKSTYEKQESQTFIRVVNKLQSNWLINLFRNVCNQFVIIHF